MSILMETGSESNMTPERESWESDLVERILKLKEEKNAKILAHNYQIGEVQEIADFVGDSLDLSRRAAETDADVIVFCGVHFMAETAAILCPEKKVLLPDENASCPMANMISQKQLIDEKKKNDSLPVITYVNSSAEVKAESDWCCTSTNAISIVNVTGKKRMLFVPDKYLGLYVASKTKKELILWDGYCPTHVKIRPEDIEKRRLEYPDAKVIVHPECVPEVIELADEALSTSGMIKFAREINAKEFIIGTEVGIIYRLEKENPKKMFYPASEQAICPNMKLITLEKVLWALEDMKFEVTVPEDIAARAKKAIDRMLAIS